MFVAGNTKRNMRFLPIKKLTKWLYHPDRMVRLGWVFLVFSLLLAVAVFSLLWKPNQAEAWWNEAWMYRKKVVLNTTSGTLTDYQIPITIDTAALITAGKMQSDCDDIRVTDKNGVILPIWYSGCNTTTTKVWPKVPSVTTTGITVYIYYGNAAGTSAKTVVGRSDYPGLSCKSILDAGNSTGTGTYWVDTTNGATSDKQQVYCDMTSNGGGWMLVTAAMVDSFSENNVTKVTTADANGGAIYTFTNTETGCGGADSGATVKITNNIQWDVLKVKETLGPGAASCWATQSDGTYGGQQTNSNMTAFSSPTDTLQNCVLSCSTSPFVMPPMQRCDNAVENFAIYNTGSNRSFETVSRRLNRTSMSGPALGLSCNDDNMTTKIESIYIRENSLTYATLTVGSLGTEENSPSPVAYWKFDEGTGTKVYSSTSSLGGTTTNLVTNPSFETGTTSWSLGVNGGTWTRISTGCAVGDYCLKGVTTTTSQASVISVSGLTPGTSITVTAYLKAEGGSSARFYVSDPGYVNPIYSGSVTSNYWVRSTATKTVPAAGAVNIVLYTNVVGTAYYDGIQLEVNSTYTPYCDGAQTGGGSYVWSGTAHGSTSTCNFTTDGDLADGTAAPTWQTEDKCVSGKCLLFDGSNDYVRVPPGANINFSESDSFTVSAWIKRSSTGNIDIIFNKQENVSNEFLYGLDISATDKAEFSIAKQNVSATTSVSTTTIAENTWYFLTGTYDGTSTRLYVNGKLEDTDTKGFSASTQSVASAYIGQQYNATSHFGGSVDDVKIYKYARTVAQIKTDYTLGARSTGAGVSFSQPDNDFLNNGLVGYWPMDEIAADSCPTASADSCDKSGNVSDGTWGGNATTTGLAKYGNAVTFDGNADNVTILDSDLYSINTTNKFTASGWFYVNALAARQNILSKTSGGHEWDFRLDTNGQLLAVIYTSAGGTFMVTGSAVSAITPGQWYHTTMVVDLDKPELTLYINGVAVGTSTTTSGSYTNGTGALRIGERNDGSGDVNGRIDEVRIYNRALASNEVAALYHWAPGPVGYWPMDENTGSLTVLDKSGNNLTGIMNGTMTISDWVPGKFGSALDFDGSNDYVLSTGATQLQRTASNPWTIGGWYYIRNASGDVSTLTQVRKAASNHGYYLSYGIVTSTISTDYYGGSGAYWRVRTTNDISLNGWHHIVATHDGAGYTGVKIYVDGVSVPLTVSNAGSPTDITWTDTRMSIGADEGASPLDGQADDVKIYNYARTPAQIAWEYNQGKPVAYYKFDECQGTVINDWSQNSNGGFNGRNGTLTIGGSGNNQTVGTCSSGVSTEAWNNGTTGKFNASMSFGGTDDYVNVPGSFLYDEQTISFWAKADWTTAAGIPLSSLQWTSPDHDGFRFELLNDNLVTMIYNNAYGEYTYSHALTGSDWHQFTLTWTGTVTKSYVDGKMVDSATRTNGFAAIPGDMDIGRYNYMDNGYFTGQVDEVKIFNYAMTDEQVKLDYNNSAAVRFN